MAQIVGEVVDRLRTIGDLSIAVALNTTDPEAAKANAGKNPPTLYRNIQGQSYDDAAVVDKGSVIEFLIESRGRFGFGYRIVTGVKIDAEGRPKSDAHGNQRNSVVERLYCLDPTGQDIALKDVVRRYQKVDPEHKDRLLIKVEDFPTLEIPSDRKDVLLAMMSVSIVSWPVYGFIDGENDEAFGDPLFPGVGDNVRAPRALRRRRRRRIRSEGPRHGLRRSDHAVREVHPDVHGGPPDPRG